MKKLMRSSKNTLWCLLGCSIGDFATIIFFQNFFPKTDALIVMSLAIVNGILTSICLETIIMMKHMELKEAFKTAIGMSLISMLAMEIAMNLVDYLLVGGAALRWWSIAPSLTAGFLAALPYNYWRLARFGKACH